MLVLYDSITSLRLVSGKQTADKNSTPSSIEYRFIAILLS